MAPALTDRWRCASCGADVTAEDVIGKTTEAEGLACHLVIRRTVAGSGMPTTCGPVRQIAPDES